MKQLLRDLRHSTTVALGMGELEAELERVRPELRAAEEQNEQLMDELSKARQELSERNDQVIRLLEEHNSARAEMEAALEEARRQLLLLDELRKRNAELEAEFEVYACPDIALICTVYFDRGLLLLNQISRHLEPWWKQTIFSRDFWNDFSSLFLSLSKKISNIVENSSDSWI